MQAIFFQVLIFNNEGVILLIPVLPLYSSLQPHGALILNLFLSQTHRSTLKYIYRVAIIEKVITVNLGGYNNIIQVINHGV